MDYNHEYFSGKTAVITGAASGIGLALTEELLLSNAAKVVMADINADNLNRHASRLNAQYGGRVRGILCNVTLEEQVRDMIVLSAGFFDGGRLDLLINNAGAGFAGDFMQMTNADWKSAFDLNFFSALYGIRAALPLMLRQGGGQIINIVSGIVFLPMPCQTRYSATKNALHGLSLALRAEYGDDNIKISSATPGTTATAIWGDPTYAPDFAQTPQQSACRILNGAANNDRVIFGDDTDKKLGYDSINDKKEQIALDVARGRREGNTGFLRPITDYFN